MTRGGGVLLFGLNESSDFAVVGVGDVHRLQEEITHLASSEMEPVLRPYFLVDEVDGETISTTASGWPWCTCNSTGSSPMLTTAV